MEQIGGIKRILLKHNKILILDQEILLQAMNNSTGKQGGRLSSNNNTVLIQSYHLLCKLKCVFVKFVKLF